MYVGQGLGAVPSWCPPTTYSRTSPPADPCEIRYEFDLPVVGRTDVGVPVNQLVNDAWLHVQSLLPEIVEQVSIEARPRFNELVTTLEGSIAHLLPDLMSEMIRTQIRPELEAQMIAAQARAGVVKEDVIRAAIGVTGTLAIAIGLAAWWMKQP
jgi:hypothetical protein